MGCTSTATAKRPEVSKTQTTAIAKWKAYMLMMTGFGAGLAHGGTHLAAPCEEFTGMDWLHSVYNGRSISSMDRIVNWRARSGGDAHCCFCF